MREEYSQKIKNMSMLCAVLVVSIHVRWPSEVPLSAGWIIEKGFADGGFARIGVPFFFVVSGFFLAKHFSETGWWAKEVRKRVKTLAVPFFLWSIIAALLLTPLSIAADHIAHRPFGTNIVVCHNWMKVLGIDLTSQPALYPLWYVRCLFFFVLTSPFFRKCMRGRWAFASLGITFIFALLAEYCQYYYPTVGYIISRGYSLSFLFYFLVGMFICKTDRDLNVRWCGIACGIVGVSLLVLKLACDYHGCFAALFVRKLALPFLLYSTWHFMPAVKLPQWAYCSFPMYVMHVVFLQYISAALKQTSLDSLSQSFLVLLGTVVASICATAILRRYAPRFCRVAFAGR